MDFNPSWLTAAFTVLGMGAMLAKVYAMICARLDVQDFRLNTIDSNLKTLNEKIHSNRRSYRG